MPEIVTPFVLEEGGGERLRWLGDPTTLKVTSRETSGRYALAEIVSTPESFVPLHVHHREDEAFYVLDGEVSFWVGEERSDAGPGAFVFGPKDVPHRYEVTSPSARMLMLFSPGGFEGFIRETADPAGHEPRPGALEDDFDVEAMLAAAERFGAEVLDGD